MQFIESYSNINMMENQRQQQLEVNQYPKMEELIDYWSLCVILPLNSQEASKITATN